MFGLGDILRWGLVRRNSPYFTVAPTVSGNPVMVNSGASNQSVVYPVTTGAYGAVVIGYGALADSSGVSLGRKSYSGYTGTSVGFYASSSYYSVSIGAHANSQAYCVSVGYNSISTGYASVAIGSEVIAYKDSAQSVVVGTRIESYDGVSIGRDIHHSYHRDDHFGRTIAIGSNHSIGTQYDATVIGHDEVVNIEWSFVAVASNSRQATKVRMALIAGAGLDDSYLAFQYVDQLAGEANGRKISMRNLFEMLRQFGAEEFNTFEGGSSAYGGY